MASPAAAEESREPSRTPSGDVKASGEPDRAELPVEIDPSAGNEATFGDLLDLWFPLHDAGPSTKATYANLIKNHIRPGLGAIPLVLHQSASTPSRGLLRRIAPVQAALRWATA